jgi:hypothetical protein
VISELSKHEEKGRGAIGNEFDRSAGGRVRGLMLRRSQASEVKDDRRPRRTARRSTAFYRTVERCYRALPMIRSITKKLRVGYGTVQLRRRNTKSEQ